MVVVRCSLLVFGGILKDDVLLLMVYGAILRYDKAILRDDVAILMDDGAILTDDGAILMDDRGFLKDNKCFLRDDEAILKDFISRIGFHAGGRISGLRMRGNEQKNGDLLKILIFRCNKWKRQK